MRPLVIAHSGCRDGFAAAVVAHIANHGIADFHFAAHGQEPPWPEITSDRAVWILDFSYPIEQMVRIFRLAGPGGGCLDHHETSAGVLEQLRPAFPKSVFVFDNERSGAGLAWDHLMPGSPRPWWVDYVEDRDLWRFNLPFSKILNAYLGVVPFDFAAWTDLGKVAAESLVTVGIAVLDKVAQYVAEVRKNAIGVVLDWRDSDGVQWRRVGCPLVNAAQVDISELLGSFIEKPGDIALGWFQRADGLFQYSIRSHGPEAAEIAKYHGGGGHAQAAGFQCRVPPPWHVPAPRHS